MLMYVFWSAVVASRKNVLGYWDRSAVCICIHDSYSSHSTCTYCRYFTPVIRRETPQEKFSFRSNMRTCRSLSFTSAIICFVPMSWNHWYWRCWTIGPKINRENCKILSLEDDQRLIHRWILGGLVQSKYQFWPRESLNLKTSCSKNFAKPSPWVITEHLRNSTAAKTSPKLEPKAWAPKNVAYLTGLPKHFFLFLRFRAAILFPSRR